MPRPSIPLAFAALAIAAPAAGSVTDFRLPPDRSETPEVEGPVVDNLPRPTAAPTPTPTPTASPSIVVPAITPSPTSAAPSPSSAPTRSAPRAGTTPTPAPAPAPTATGGATPPPAAATPQETAGPVPSPVALPTASPSLSPPSRESGAVSASEPAAWWIWALGAIALLAAAAAAVVFLRRRSGAPSLRAAAVPTIERPRVPAPGSAAEPTTAAPHEPASPPVSAQEPIAIGFVPVRLSLTLMAATLSYRLTLANPSHETLRDIYVGGDLTSAHASVPREELVAGPGIMLDVLHHIETLEPGESAEFEGELRLPIPQILPIEAGNAVLYVPVVRFAARAGDKAAYMTATTGQMAPSGAILPVRLDLGPRIHNGLASRTF